MINKELEFTGERFVPTLGGEIELEHMNRYHFANTLVKDKVVLDIACGEGYGSALFSQTALKVYGVDIDEETITHAQQKYIKPNLEFFKGSCLNINLPNESIDVLVSFETLEHIEEHDKYLSEIKRVLNPNGIMLISTPNTEIYSKGDYKNEFHLLELTETEFKTLIKNYFNHSLFYNQQVNSTSFIVNTERTSGKSHFIPKQSILKPKYLIAVGSNSPLENLPDLSLYINAETDLIAELHSEYQAIISRMEIENKAKIEFFESQLAFIRRLKSNPIAKIFYKLYKKFRHS